MYGQHTHQQFAEALTAFYEGVQVISENHRQKHYPNAPQTPWGLDWLRKYVRVTHDGAYCFVELATGDVLKPAKWSAPAPTARGNIYEPDHGLTRMGPYGPANNNGNTRRGK